MFIYLVFSLDLALLSDRLGLLFVVLFTVLRFREGFWVFFGDIAGWQWALWETVVGIDLEGGHLGLELLGILFVSDLWPGRRRKVGYWSVLGHLLGF